METTLTLHWEYEETDRESGIRGGWVPVSYTHLTLPTT
jgi:hypothetical protein